MSENINEEDTQHVETTEYTEGEKENQENKAYTEDTAEKNDKEERVTEKEKKSKRDTVYIPIPKENKSSSDDESSSSYPKTWIVKPQPTPLPTSRPTATPRPKKRVIEYWIQAGSFLSRSKADDLNQKLAEHGFQGQVQTRELNNVTHYRVRIGPYQNRSEANKFLEWLKVLDGMQGSYISEVPTDKWVN